MPPEFADPPGYHTATSIRAMMNRARASSRRRRSRRRHAGELDFWEYDELGYIIAGTPERVEQRVRELGRPSCASAS